MEINPRFTGALNDFTGREIPGQETFQAADAVVSLMLSRFSQTTLNMLAAQPFTSFANSGGSPGQWSRLAVGSLTYGISTYQLMLVNAFAVTIGGVPPDLAAQGIPSDLPAGTRFINAKVVKLVPSPQGAEVARAGVIFDCKPIFNPTSSADAYGTPPFGGKLWDYDMTAVPREDPS